VLYLLFLLLSSCLSLVNILWVYCKWLNISPQVLGLLGLLVKLLYKVYEAEFFSSHGLMK
jgi:hypothetical protein